eukprot:154711-Chlamydomonas_euryale.AAC.1
MPAGHAPPPHRPHHPHPHCTEAHVGMAVGFHNSIIAYNGMHKVRRRARLGADAACGGWWG